MRKVLLVIIAVAVFVSGFFIYKKIERNKMIEEATAFLSTDKIYNGIKVAGVDLGGLTKEEALEKIQKDVVEEKLNKSMHLKFDKFDFELKMKDLGLELSADELLNSAYGYGREDKDILERYEEVKQLENKPMDIFVNDKYDSEKVRSYAKSLAEQIDRPMEASDYVFNGTKFDIGEPKPGYKLDVDKTVKLIMDNVGVFNDITLPVEVEEATVLNEQLARINGVIGKFTTSFSGSSANRINNIQIATKTLSNKLVMPGEKVSFNNCTGPRSAENGYKDAGVIIGDQLQSGTGGGVCQTSTTLYNALLLADVTILQRSPHSLPVAYVPRGTDGAVAWGSLDLVFQNNHDFPIYIVGNVDGTNVTFTIYGDTTVKNYQVVINAELVETVPFNTIEKVDNTKEPGFVEVTQEGRTGYKYRTTKSIVVDGVVQSTTVISNDYYRGKDKIVTKGPEAPVQPPQDNNVIPPVPPFVPTPDNTVPSIPVDNNNSNDEINVDTLLP